MSTGPLRDSPLSLQCLFLLCFFKEPWASKSGTAAWSCCMSQFTDERLLCILRG